MEWPTCDAVTNEIVSSESTFEANGHRKRVHAYSTLIKSGKGAPHPQLRANAPGLSPANELNGSNRAHSLAHVRPRLQNQSWFFSSLVFSDPCAAFQSNATGQRDRSSFSSRLPSPSTTFANCRSLSLRTSRRCRSSRFKGDE